MYLALINFWISLIGSPSLSLDCNDTVVKSIPLCVYPNWYFTVPKLPVNSTLIWHLNFFSK